MFFCISVLNLTETKVGAQTHIQTRASAGQLAVQKGELILVSSKLVPTYTYNAQHRVEVALTQMDWTADCVFVVVVRCRSPPQHGGLDQGFSNYSVVYSLLSVCFKATGSRFEETKFAQNLKKWEYFLITKFMYFF